MIRRILKAALHFKLFQLASLTGRMPPASLTSTRVASASKQTEINSFYVAMNFTVGFTKYSLIFSFYLVISLDLFYAKAIKSLGRCGLGGIWVWFKEPPHM